MEPNRPSTAPLIGVTGNLEVRRGGSGGAGLDLPLRYAEAIVAGVGNYDVSKWLSVVPYPYRIADAEEFLRKIEASANFAWAICDADGLQGLISIEAELGYWLARPVWRKGYGFEAAHAVLSWWFADPHAGALTACVFDGNTRSGDVLAALAFKPIDRRQMYAKAYGQMVQATVMGLAREDWLNRHAFVLRTPRLTLRPLTLEDTHLLAPLGAQSVTRQTSSLTTDWTAETAKDWLAARLWTGAASGMLGVFRGDAFVGTIGAGGHPPNVGWMLVPAYWGQGFATEALQAFLPAYFARITTSSVVADIFEDNPASQAVARKLGFQETGRDIGTSRGRLEPAPVITYALSRDSLKDVT